MKRGRRKLPEEVLKQRGTYRNHRHKDLKEKLKAPPISDIPEPKMNMNEDAEAEYYRLCEELKELGVLSNIDLSLIEMAANYYGTFVENYEYIINKHGSMSSYLYSKTNNTAMIYTSMNHAYKSYLDIGSRFGITPTARVNIKAPEKEGSNEFEDFMLKMAK